MSLAWRACCIALLLLFSAVAGAESNYKPTQVEVQAVHARTGDYFQAMARADYAGAYAMLTPGMQAMFTPARWVRLGMQSRALRGEQFTRKLTAITWMLDPPDSAGPGLYAVLDFQGQSDKAPLQTEYLIWYRAPGETEFRLLRHEQDLGVMPAKPAAVPAPAPLDEVAPGKSGIGYATVAEARAALAGKAGASANDTADGWHVVVEESPTTVWSFTPAGHPAFPSVVRRMVVERDGAVYIDMSAICEADKAACDRLMREFQALNKKTADEAH